MPRTIATVSHAGHDFEFFGIDVADYAPPAAARRALLEPDALDARSFTSRLDTWATPKKVQRMLAEYAEQVRGHAAAYCSQGRERSALAAFVFLYVIHGMTKDEAKQAVIDAVVQSGVDSELTERMFAHEKWTKLPTTWPAEAEAGE